MPGLVDPEPAEPNELDELDLQTARDLAARMEEEESDDGTPMFASLPRPKFDSYEKLEVSPRQDPGSENVSNSRPGPEMNSQEARIDMTPPVNVPHPDAAIDESSEDEPEPVRPLACFGSCRWKFVVFFDISIIRHPAVNGDLPY